jgi:PAS domain S-box-containing protein
MSKLKEIYRNLIELDADNPEVFENQRKKLLLNILLSIGIIIFSTYFLYNLVRGEMVVAFINLATDLVVIVLVYVVNKKNKITLVSYIGTIYLGFHLILINTFYSDKTITLIWTLSYPIIVLFLLGRKKGLYAILIFVVIFYFLYLFLQFWNYNDGFPIEFIIEYVSAFILIFLLSLLFEHVRERSQRKLVQSKSRLDNTLIELKKTNEALIESELKFRTLIDNANDGIIIIQNYKITYANQITLDMVGFNADEIIGRNFFDFLDPLERDSVIAIHLNRLKTREKIETYETIILSKEAKKIYVEINSSIFIYEGNVSVIAILRDVTQRKIQEDERTALIAELQQNRDIMTQDAIVLKEMNEKLSGSENYLREVISIKNKFMSILSHDLLNPISGANQVVDLLNSNYDTFSDEERRELINTLNSSSKNLFVLVKNLLTWARLQTNSIEVLTSDIDLNDLVFSTIELLSLQASNKHIKIISKIPGNTKILGDLDMIQTVLRNLISNAIKFSPVHSEVVIDCVDKDTKYEIHIIDKGVGISWENIPKLFRIDSRISTEGTNDEIGSGMGLILCKEFIEKNHGNIWVESEKGRGSTFKFTLPKSKD